MSKKYSDDLFVWPDGSWCFRYEYCEECDKWRGDDYKVLTSETPEWSDFLLGEGVIE